MSVAFTKEMKKDYTIVAPNMSPIHFALFEKVLINNGYKALVLNNEDPSIIQKGLKYVHNDMCYPALLVIGQMIDAIERGLIDSHKCALAITQTGGGCRASNYYFLLIKALERAGLDYIPVISLNLAGMNKNPGFKITLTMILQAVSALLYGDEIMYLRNQVKPYEVNEGETDGLVKKWVEDLSQRYKDNRGYFWSNITKNLNKISDDFASIPVKREKKVKVGIVGEIYMKYSRFGNSNLQSFLEHEGCEVMLPPLLGFFLYGVSNAIKDNEYYGTKPIYSKVDKHFILPFLEKSEKWLRSAISRHKEFVLPSTLSELEENVDGIIDRGCKMGEGWLLTAEMVELIKKGYSNIVCTQPFGCLPNHIVGKAMIRPLKEKYPESNIVPIDYDPSATRVNQENRIKLMLAVAREHIE